MSSVNAGELFPDVIRELIPVCKRFATSGTPKQAKQAIRCLYINMTEDSNSVFSEVLEVSNKPYNIIHSICNYLV